MPSKAIPSTCKECYIGCASLIHMQDDKIVRVSGVSGEPHSKGAFCVKGMNAATGSIILIGYSIRSNA